MHVPGGTCIKDRNKNDDIFKTFWYDGIENKKKTYKSSRNSQIKQHV